MTISLGINGTILCNLGFYGNFTGKLSRSGGFMRSSLEFDGYFVETEILFTTWDFYGNFTGIQWDFFYLLRAVI